MGVRKSPATAGAAKTTGPSAGRYRIQAIDRAIAILNCFSALSPELHVREVAAMTGLHKATAHRILMAMQHHSMVEQDATTGRYHLGLQLVRLGEHAVGRLDVSVIARPVLVDLAARTGERSYLAVLDGDQIVILDRVDGTNSVSVPSLPGRLFAAHTTSLGKAMLAALDDGAVRSVMGQRPLVKMTPRTHGTVAALIEDLQRGRKRGFVVSEEELSIGLNSVAAAILDRSGAPVAAINVSGSSSRLRGARLAALGAEVKKAAARISERLGHGR
jgi:IclR family acetate operon transcriptional repressor